MATKELSIKLLIDTKTDKLCFAEAGSDFVDFLSGLLSLPLGTVANLLMKERMPGSISSVLGSMEKLDANYKSREGRLSPPIAPATLSRLQQLLGPNLSNGNRIFTCKGYLSKTGGSKNHLFGCSTGYLCTCPCNNRGYFSVTTGTVCPLCNGPMDTPMMTAPFTGASLVAPTHMTYTVKDDLWVSPASNVLSGITLLTQCGVKDITALQEKTVMLSGITLLTQCGVKDITALQEKTVKIGEEEALAILVASLSSKTVLTDVFMPKKNARCKRESPEEVI